MKAQANNRFTFTLIIVGCAIVPVIAINIFTSMARYQDELARTQASLRGAAIARNAILTDFLEQKIKEATYLAASPAVVESALEWAKGAERNDFTSAKLCL